jgi:hypothetical protein
MILEIPFYWLRGRFFPDDFHSRICISFVYLIDVVESMPHFIIDQGKVLLMATVEGLSPYKLI